MLKHPWIALHKSELFEVKDRAVDLAQLTFGSIAGDDEADAVKHYIGSFLLTLNYGERFAFDATNVHEKDYLTMASLMDRFNNAVARGDALAFRARGETPTDDQILDLAMLALQQGRIVWLYSKHKGPVNRSREFERWSFFLLRSRLY